MFQFPANPVLDQQFSPVGGPTYTWNGTGWAPFTRVYNGGLTFTGPVLHADGTMANPGISWANEPTSGFTRYQASGFSSNVNGVSIWSWSPGALYIQPTTALTAAGAANFNGAATFNAAATFNSTVTGITPTKVGLPNVANVRQVYELRNGASAIYIGWNGNLEAQVDSTYFGNKWPINITGAAARVYNHGDSNQTGMVFHWAGQGGQPSWVWGGGGAGTEGTDMYVWQPSNFSVNYANSSNTCNTANNSNAVSGISGWNYANRQKNPVYVWSTDGSGSDQYLTQPGYLRVDYANGAGNLGGYTEANFIHEEWCYKAGMAGSNSWQCFMWHPNIGQIYLIRQQDGIGGIRREDGQSRVNFHDQGGGWFAYISYTGGSDERMKDNIIDSEIDAEAEVRAMRLVGFNYNDKAHGRLTDIRHACGFTSQNLKSIRPELTSDAPDGMLYPDANWLLPLAFKAIQQLIKRVDELEAK